MNSVTITGVHGQLFWGYALAGDVRRWTATRSNGHGTLTGTIATADGYRVQQRPLVFVVPHDKGEWRWPLGTVDITNGVLTATIGELEH